MTRRTIADDFQPVVETEELPPVAVAQSDAPKRTYFKSVDGDKGYEAALKYWTPGREVTMEVPAMMEAHRDEVGYWIP